jgi:hypothetical protein
MWRSTAVLLCASLIATVTACTPATAGRQAGSSASQGQSAGRGQLASPACAWPAAVNADTIIQHPALNVGVPDSSAAYWATEFEVQPGLRITLSGHYPDSRYFSVQVYTATGRLFTDDGVSSGLTGYRIAPDPGSVNPWQHEAQPGGRFTVTLQSDVAPGQVNTLPLAPAGTATGTAGVVYFRVYLPAHENLAQVPLPAVTFTLGAASRQVPVCRTTVTRLPGFFGAAPGTLAKVNAALKTYGGIIPFYPERAAAGGFPNADTGYLQAYVRPPHNGEVMVIRGKAPTAPAGTDPSPFPAPGTDVQYWSLCINVYQGQQPVVLNRLPNGQEDFGCRHDSQVSLDRDGYYTFVVGAESQRAAIERIPGATFLPFSTAYPTQIHYFQFRDMVANPDFAQAIQNVPHNESPASAAAVMGPYYPRAAFCPLATLAHGGPQACLAASA